MQAVTIVTVTGTPRGRHKGPERSGPRRRLFCLQWTSPSVPDRVLGPFSWLSRGFPLGNLPSSPTGCVVRSGGSGSTRPRLAHCPQGGPAVMLRAVGTRTSRLHSVTYNEPGLSPRLQPWREMSNFRGVPAEKRGVKNIPLRVHNTCCSPPKGAALAGGGGRRTSETWRRVREARCQGLVPCPR